MAVEIMVLTDSRGNDLEDRIKKDLLARVTVRTETINVTVHALGGARIENILETLDTHFPDKKSYDITYNFVRVNNLTKKGYNGKVTPVFDNVPELVESLTDHYTKLKSDLSLRIRKVIISQIVGIDIDSYNRYYNEGFWYYHQLVINSALPILSHTINLINRDDEVKGPWITSTIHDFVNHRQYNKYAKLKDGLHPHDTTKAKWAKLFVDSILKNI